MSSVENSNEFVSKLHESTRIVKRCRRISSESPFTNKHPIPGPSIKLVIVAIKSAIEDLILILTFKTPNKIFVPFVPEVIKALGGRGKIGVMRRILFPKSRSVSEDTIITSGSDSFVCTDVL